MGAIAYRISFPPTISGGGGGLDSSAAAAAEENSLVRSVVAPAVRVLTLIVLCILRRADDALKELPDRTKSIVIQPTTIAVVVEQATIVVGNQTVSSFCSNFGWSIDGHRLSE